MYNIYVTNESKGDVYVRLQSQKISILNENFHHEFDKLMGNDNPTDDLQSKSSVNSYLVRWGFCNIPAQVTMPFAVEVANDETRLYASLYAYSKLWIMDYEVNCVRYGCVYVRSKSDANSSSHSSQCALYLCQANPNPVWIPRKKGDNLPGGSFKAGIDAFEGELYFGRSSLNGNNPCKVNTKKVGSDYAYEFVFNSWKKVNGEEVPTGEILKDTGCELVLARTGDPVPPNAVIGGVSDTEGTLYLGRVGGNVPCSITSEGGRIKYFSFFAGRKKQVESGEIIVLTK